MTSVCVWLVFAALSAFGYVLGAMSMGSDEVPIRRFASPLLDLNLFLGWAVPLTIMVIGLGFSPERYADRALVATGLLLLGQIAVLSLSSIFL